MIQDYCNIPTAIILFAVLVCVFNWLLAPKEPNTSEASSVINSVDGYDELGKDRQAVDDLVLIDMLDDAGSSVTDEFEILD